MPRGSSAWNVFVKEYASQHPEVRGKELFRSASVVYRENKPEKSESPSSESEPEITKEIENLKIAEDVKPIVIEAETLQPMASEQPKPKRKYTRRKAVATAD